MTQPATPPSTEQSTPPPTGREVPAQVRPRIRDFWADLPREGRLLLSVVAFEFIGTGLVLPFNVVYLHEIRDFPLATVGILLAIEPLVGALVTGPAGTVIDRVGPRRVMLAVLVGNVLGQLVMAFATTIPVAVLATVIIGASFGAGWPTSQSLISSVVPTPIRGRYFGMNFTLLNLGIGLGGVLGGLVTDVHRPATFVGLYLGNAVSYVPSLLLLLMPLRRIGGAAPTPEHHEAVRVNYLAVLRKPAMKTVCVLSFVAAFAGYAQLNAGMPAFARAVGEVSTRGIGFAFAANTLLIVLLQLAVLQRMEGRRRTRALAVMAVVWAVSWLLLGATSLVPGTLGATLLVAGCATVFAFGETLLQPTLPVIVNDLAPDHLRGRYTALSSIFFQAAAVGGPVVAGFLLGQHLGGVYIGVLLVSCALVAVVSVLRLEPQLDPAANGIR